MRIRFSCAVLLKLMGAGKQLQFILLVPGWVRALVALVVVESWVGDRWLGDRFLFCVVLVACGRSRGIWGWLWFSCGMARCGVGLVDILRGSVASIGGILAFAGGLGTGPSFDGVWILS